MNLENAIGKIPNIGKLSHPVKVVVVTGAGISQESGISTFRDTGGLWDRYNIYEVATPEAWHKNRKLVLDFYNERRRELLSVKPNAAHKALVELEEKFDVEILTQNIDDLHERAGSSKVVHIHGELLKARSTVDQQLVYPIVGGELSLGDYCEKGSQLRPHIVWFGEEVPMMGYAEQCVSKADILLVVGTSLSVYPAAGLLYSFQGSYPIINVNPYEDASSFNKGVIHIKEKAGKILGAVVRKLME